MIARRKLDELLMPIEFTCKVCSATIRVPDKAAGGKGKCPKCGVRLTVPKKAAAKPKSKSAPAEEESFYAPEISVGPSAEPEPFVEEDPDAVVELETASFEPSDLTDPPADDFQFGKPQIPAPVRPSPARRMKQKKKQDRTIMLVGFAVLGFLLVAGFFAYSYLSAERLAGELTAASAATLELPPVLIGKAKIKMPAEEAAPLLRKLELGPLPMTSNSMQIDLSGSPDGLKISVAAGAVSHYFRVDVKDNEAVQKYLSKHRTELEERRTKEVDQATTAFFNEYKLILAKKSSAEAVAPFRDSLAIPSLVGGFGYCLIAEYGRSRYRCIYEDKEGGLYFLLPAEATSFRVVGRPDASENPMIPVDFQVKVEGEIAPLKKPEESESKKGSKKGAAKPDKDDPETDKEKMDGNN